MLQCSYLSYLRNQRGKNVRKCFFPTLRTLRPLLPMPPPQSAHHFLREGLQMCCITKEDPLGIVPKYSPRGLTFWDVTQMRPYHKKLKAHFEDINHILLCECFEALDIAIAASLLRHEFKVLTLDAHLGKGALKAESLKEEVREALDTLTSDSHRLELRVDTKDVDTKRHILIYVTLIEAVLHPARGEYC